MNHPDLLPDARRPWAARSWWIALAIGAAGFAFVWPATPHAREIGAAWQLVAKLLGFAFLCCAIAFSGFLDVMRQVVNPVPIPERADAPHINLFTGGAIWVTPTHVPLIVGVNLLPLDRWIARRR
ncbi:hypothetical protein [Nonomuraea sp. NPDC003201]